MWDSPPPKKNLHIICHCYKVRGEASPQCRLYVYIVFTMVLTWDRGWILIESKFAVFPVNLRRNAGQAGIS